MGFWGLGAPQHTTSPAPPPAPPQAGIHPEQPAHTLSREAFDTVWAHSVDLLQRGFASGSILTVDPEDAKLLGKPWTRR